MEPTHPDLAPVRDVFLTALAARRAAPSSPEAKTTHAALVGAQERFADAHPDLEPDWPSLFRSWDPDAPAEGTRRRSTPTRITQAEKDLCEQAHAARASSLKFLETDRGLLLIYDLMGLDPNTATDAQAQANAVIREQITYSLRTATTLAVPDDLCALVNGAAPTYPDATIHSSDILVPHGWAYFAEPIPDPDPLIERRLPVRALSWWIYTADKIPGHASNVDPSTPVATILAWTEARNLPGTNERNLSHFPRVVPVNSLFWQLDAEDGGDLWGDPRATALTFARAPYVKALMTVWAVIRQRMVATDPIHSVSPRRFRTLERPDRPPVNTSLNLARLAAPTRYTYDWALSPRLERDHRWVVRTHWRRTHDRNGRPRKPTLIPSYVKGPEGTELRGADRILLPPPPPPLT